MATTTTRGWHYPDENENPYWDNFVAFANAIDSDVNGLYTASVKIPYSIITAAGDLILGTGAATAARLPRGTTGQPLLATATTLAYGALDLDSTSAVTGTLGVAHGGTNLASGTSGGVLGFTGSTTLASSAALTASALVLGGGAGATPTALGSLGTTTTVLHGNAAGVPSFGAVSLTADVTGVLPAANHDGIPKSLVDATGDLIVASANDTPTRLAKGAIGTVLRPVVSSPGLGWGQESGLYKTIVSASTVTAAGEQVPSTGLIGITAGDLTEVGSVLRCRAGGQVVTAGGHAPLLRLKYAIAGVGYFVDVPLQTTAGTTANWALEGSLVITTGTAALTWGALGTLSSLTAPVVVNTIYGSVPWTASGGGTVQLIVHLATASGGTTVGLDAWAVWIDRPSKGTGALEFLRGEGIMPMPVAS